MSQSGDDQWQSSHVQETELDVSHLLSASAEPSLTDPIDPTIARSLIHSSSGGISSSIYLSSVTLISVVSSPLSTSLTK